MLLLRYGTFMEKRSRTDECQCHGSGFIWKRLASWTAGRLSLPALAMPPPALNRQLCRLSLSSPALSNEDEEKVCQGSGTEASSAKKILPVSRRAAPPVSPASLAESGVIVNTSRAVCVSELSTGKCSRKRGGGRVIRTGILVAARAHVPSGHPGYCSMNISGVNGYFSLSIALQRP